nr:chitin-binding domain protein cbd-1 [Drosophila kikkawai]
MAQFKTKHYVVSLCLALSLFVGSLNAECCTDGETKCDPDDCTKYSVCCHGEFVSKSCIDGEYWNPEIGECDTNNGECYPPNCEEGEIEANPDDCAGYLECVNGIVVDQSCPDGYFFNETECTRDTCGVCVNCTEGSTKPEPSGDCTKYLLCSGGKYVTVSCDSGYYWNNTWGECLEDNGECNGSPSCTEGELEWNPLDCAGYRLCSNGSLVNKTCPDGAYFDNNMRACVQDTNGTCVNCTEGSKQPEPSGDCTKYLLCSGGKYVTVSCDSGYYWNNTWGECLEDNGECNGSPSCTEGELEWNPLDCAGYRLCSNGSLVNKTCPDGAYFDNNRRTCVPDTNGTCVNCTEGSKQPEPSGDCTKYQICAGGKYVTMSCSAGEYWNNKSKICETDNGECNGTPSCTEGDKKANPSDCAGYLQCVNGNYVAMKCSATEFFNTTLNKCVVDTNNVCIPKTCDPQCCDLPNNSMWPVEKNCSAFFQCVNGKYVQQRCPNNLQFNNITSDCDYPENVGCDDGTAPPSGPSAGPSGTYCESQGRCVGQRDGTMFAGANACSSSYIVCQCECEVDFSCSSGLVFNEQIKTCDWASNVKC